MRYKVTKTYDKYKNDRKNETIEKLYRKQKREYKKDGKNEAIEKLYRKQQKDYKKLKRKAKKNYENIQNETVADEEAMTKKIKKPYHQHTTQSYNIKTPNWEVYRNQERNM